MFRITRSTRASRAGEDTGRRRGYLHPESGQSLVELAFVTPLLLLLAVGVIEMGRYMYIGILVGNAARAGAAYGAAEPGGGPSGTGIQDAACADFNSNLPGITCSGYENTSPPAPPSPTGLTANQLVVTWYQSCGCDNGGQVATLTNGRAYCDNVPPADMSACTGKWVALINVQATGKFTPLVPFPGIPNPITISKTASLRVSP